MTCKKLLALKQSTTLPTSLVTKLEFTVAGIQMRRSNVINRSDEDQAPRMSR